MNPASNASKTPAQGQQYRMKDAAAWPTFSRASWVTAVYALFATLWILFSDKALSLLAPSPELLIQASVYKGLAFVVVTSVLLLLTLRKAFGRLGESFTALRLQNIEMERLRRTYAALSQINQAIVWTPDRDTLLQKICDVLIDHGGFSMAWIGWHDPETQRLMPVAERGDVNAYLKSIQIYTDDRPEGRGPSGTAFREKHSCICNDIQSDPMATPWREEARRRGFRSSAAIPIQEEGEVRGTLNVYAVESGFFQDKEVELLEEAATDISYALDNFRREAQRQQAEARVLAERQFSDTMIESMPGILYFYDTNGRFLRWNRQFESVTGYSGAEIATMHPLDFFTDEDKPLLESRIADVFEKGESSVEAPFQARDGTVMPYFFTGKRVDFEGRTCLVGVGIDISERKQAEQALQKSEQRYRSTLDNILEGCQLLGFDWSYLYLNDAAAEHNRRPNSEMLGRRMPEVWPGIDQTRLFSLIRRCMEERLAFHEETEFAFPDGHKGWFDVRGQPVPEGVFMLSIDITERHQAEMALRELNESLEHKVIERTTELQAALVRAEAADRLKSAFLATMSHELRTPLNSIIGFTGILLQGMAGTLNPEQNKQLGMVRTSARHLLELINDVLDLSKIEAGQLEVRAAPFDLPASIERVITTVKTLADAKSLGLTSTIHPSLGEMVSDERRVGQVLLNLLNNAIKFTDQGKVILSAELVEDFRPSPDVPSKPAVRISVRDTGIGIKSADLGTLFQPFRQIDSGLTRQHEGTGLGLAICRRLTHLLGGEISATSEWSKGSNFMVILPLQPQDSHS